MNKTLLLIDFDSNKYNYKNDFKKYTEVLETHKY